MTFFVRASKIYNASALLRRPEGVVDLVRPTSILTMRRNMFVSSSYPSSQGDELEIQETKAGNMEDTRAEVYGWHLNQILARIGK